MTGFPLHASCFLLALSLLQGCKSVRTVYDENGREVKESVPGQEKDLESYFNEEFASSFSEKKNKEGVPETTSAKVSRFQKDLDAARRSEKRFHTTAFSGIHDNDARAHSFDGSNKSFDANKAYEGTFSSNIDTQLRPAFMKEGKGLVRSESVYGGISPTDRSPMEGADAAISGRPYATHASNISTSDRSGYFESRKERFGKPHIINYRQYYKKSIEETRTLLGRDKGTEE